MAAAALFILPPAAFAQAPHAPEQTVHFTVFSSRPVEGLVFTPHTKAAPQKIVFYPTARSPHYEYHGAMPLRFTDAATGAVVAEATIPPEMHDVLLLFTATEPSSSATASKAGAPAGLRYHLAELDDGAARHGPGGLVVVNLSGLALGGTVDGKDVTLKAGLNPALTVGHSVDIRLRTTFKARSYQAYADTMQLKKSERALLFLFPPFYKGSLEVQSRLLIDEPPVH